MQTINSQLGTRIRQYRKRLGLTQETLALNSGINVSFLGDVERGIKKPSIESLEKLLNALNVTFLEFFDFEVELKPYDECTALEKLNISLQNRTNDEIEMIYGIVKQILLYDDRKQT
jgi:transcriptional regulator with XRE-family HTH domain